MQILLLKNWLGTLGPQQTFAMLGWQQNPDYKPMPHYFDYWRGTNPTVLQEEQIKNCELHVKDLSRLYASYGVEAKPRIYRSCHTALPQIGAVYLPWP